MRKKLNNIIFISFWLLALNNSLLLAQEYLVGKTFNEELNANKNFTLLKAAVVPVIPIDTIELPILDDFSKPGKYPDTAFWSDNEVYINYTRAINPPSIGVATFDMFNHNGEIHENSTTKVFLADSLTSRPINLNYPASSNIYLSFQYQRGGNGDAPEEEDSLIVEFYSPELDTWNIVYSIPGGDYSEFKTAIIPVDSTKYLHKGFRFKIKNLASFEQINNIPYRERDGDHWHLDFVYLDKDRSETDTIIEDIAFNHTFWPILKNYTSIPWEHCTQDIIFNNRKKELELKFISTFSWKPNVAANFNVVDLAGNGQPLYDYIGNQNTTPFKEDTFLIFYDYPFNSNSKDVAEFKIQAYLETNIVPDVKSTLLRQNDTLTYIQEFNTYYSYDDGSAEYGYGISDEGADNARIAIRYNTYKKDTLWGIYYSFLQYKLPEEAIGGLYFNVAVWNNINNQPGDLIYTEYVPVGYGNDLNTFTYYPIDTTLIVDSIFYVGIIQRTDDFLNIGFDLNTNSRINTLYNIDGSWDTTKFSGSLMIRPYFGKEIIITGIPNQTIEKSLFIMFPNPANNILNISYDDFHTIDYVNIYNTAGILLQSIHYNINDIDISHLSNGLYFIQLKLDGLLPRTEKLIIQR